MDLQQLSNIFIKKIRTGRGNSSYFKFLSNLFDEYLQKIDEFSDEQIQELIPTSSKSELKEAVKLRCEALKKIFNFYMEGNIQDAISEMDEYISNTKFPNTVPIEKVSKAWYRARNLNDSSRKYTKDEMFHIPFDKRDLVENYRYSISGYPCLYLGKTILACWEEMKRPVLDNFCVSMYKVKKEKIKVVDLRFPVFPNTNALFFTDEEKSEKKAYLLWTWPLIIACTIKTVTPKSPFKYEYVIPQVLMLSLLKKKDIYGVVFTSTQMDKDMSEDERLHYNLALPTQDIKPDGYCKILEGIFDNTRGVPYMEAEIKGNLENDNVWAEFSKDRNDEYNSSKFGMMEKYLFGIAKNAE